MTLTGRILGIATVLLHLAAPTLAHAAAPTTCFTPLFGFGPVNRAHEVPEYYQHSNGLALQACLDLACDPALGIPDLPRPVSVPDHFPVEVCDSRAIRPITGGTIK